MLVFSKNKYISCYIKEKSPIPMFSWVDDFNNKPVRKLPDGSYKQIGGYSYTADPEWVAEVDDKYLGG